MEGWNLSDWIREIPSLAQANVNRWPEHASFFETTVQGFIASRFAPPDGLLARMVIDSAAGKDAAAGLSILDDTSAEWKKRHWPTGEMPLDDSHVHLFCLHQACWAFIRSLARCGFFAVAGFQLDAFTAHRRTREALIDIELLLDDASLARPYWAHASETTKVARTSNPFYIAACQARARAGDPTCPATKRTPLQQAIGAGPDFAILNAGPHAGAQHGASGLSDGRIGFFDRMFKNGAVHAVVFAHDALHLADVLAAKLRWLDSALWVQFVSASRQEAGRLLVQSTPVALKVAGASEAASSTSMDAPT
jgi:hypothetical protein